MQCACAIVSSVASSALQYYSTLSDKRHDFRKKKNIVEHKMCVLISFKTFVWNVPHSKNVERGVIKRSSGIHIKCPLFLSDFNEN
jgi:hypothetical protein